MLEIKGENPFRIRAYQKAAQNIENLAEDIALIAQRNELDTLPGIGKDLSQKITEIITTGTLQKYEELKKEIPEGLMEIVTIPGLGPRTVKMLYDELRVESIDQLEGLAQAHKLQGLARNKGQDRRKYSERDRALPSEVSAGAAEHHAYSFPGNNGRT